MNNRRAMVFHAPYPMEDNPTGASRVRPHRMRQAFSDLGYEVVDVSGTKPERRHALKMLKSKTNRGWRPDFMYSENSTMPNLFATSIKEGVNPFLDTSIMGVLHNARVPLGMFYRDAYWKFSRYRRKNIYGLMTVPLNLLDLYGYRRNKLHLFLPSIQMAKILRLKPPLTWSALPPAGDTDKVLPLPQSDLELLYVGGFIGHYQFDVFLQALSDVSNVEMNIVTRRNEWEETILKKQDLPIKQIHPYHLNTYDLEPLFARSQVCVLAVNPSEYWDFAVPFKLFEYISYGRPILASAGTEAARIVEKLDVGWVVPYERRSIARMIMWLRDHPEEIAQKAENTREAAVNNTWLNRAQTVVDTLTTPE